MKLNANLGKGLMVTFRDPRAVVPTLSLLSEEYKYERIKGPLIVGGEVLPGPGGFRPQMGERFESVALRGEFEGSGRERSADPER